MHTNVGHRVANDSDEVVVAEEFDANVGRVGEGGGRRQHARRDVVPRQDKHWGKGRGGRRGNEMRETREFSE